jgi:hypothetical protein
MLIARDSGRISNAYSVETTCSWCKISKLRYDLEFQVMTIENRQTVESRQLIKNICAHCLTLCDNLPQMDFLCAKCGQLIIFSGERLDSEWSLFTRVIGGSLKFEEFYRRLLKDGALVGKRYCLHCLDRLWRDYKLDPKSLQLELDAPKPYFLLKK